MASVSHSNRLEDQALHSHKETRRPSVLDEDGKLSSASAATSLKYANAQDLPSFPSAGLKLSSAGAAASLADANKKSFEHWKPDSIPAANRAALLAKDYEMDPLWQPELSAAGSRAALLAHKDTPSVEIWKSQGTQHGHSAAGQALKMKSPNAITERNVNAEERQKAMMAATGAMSRNRPRSGSSPATKSSEGNWALKAANSISQKPAPNVGPFASGDPGFEAARIQNIAKNNVDRQLFGSAPPVAIEVEEKNRQDMLRASAVAMAKKMYAIQQSHIDEASGLRRGDSYAAANTSHRRNMSDVSSTAGDDATSVPGPRYENLEEAARRLAQERLAKLRDEHAEYRQYYGQTSPPPRSRLSMRLGRRASTGGKDDDSSDEEQSRRIRTQMSYFQTKLAEVDKKKQQADRNALLEIAHRNVEASLSKMDEKVFQDTGKPSPAQKELWERQARERAQKSVDEALKNVGKVHIGGGKYLDQAEIDAIARARLQPTLDEISATAEKQRARDEEIRLEHQRAQEQMAKEKAREAEIKAELKATQELEKAEARKKKAEEKQASREQAAAEKERQKKEKEERAAAAAEVKQAHKEQVAAEKEQKKKEREERTAAAAATAAEVLKQRTKDTTPDKSEAPVAEHTSTESVTPDPTDAETATAEPPAATIAEPLVLTEPAAATTDHAIAHEQVTMPRTEATEPSPITSMPREETVSANQPTTEAAETPASPTKRNSKVMTWFKSHLKGSNKAPKEESTTSTSTVPVKEDAEPARDESIRDVAMAGREQPIVSPVPESEEEPGKTSRKSSISSISSHNPTIETARPLSGVEHTAQVGRTGLKAKLMKKITTSHDDAGDPRESFVTDKDDKSDEEEFEEAKGNVASDSLALPPSISSAAVPPSPRSSHEHSKFKEEL